MILDNILITQKMCKSNAITHKMCKIIMKDTKRLNVEIPIDKYDSYRTGAKFLKVSLTQLVENAMDTYLQTHVGDIKTRLEIEIAKLEAEILARKDILKK